MLGNIFKRKNKAEPVSGEKRFIAPERSIEAKKFLADIENWKLDEIRTYVLGKHPDYRINEHRTIAVMHRFSFLRLPKNGFPNGRKEIEKTDLEQRTKKVFAIVKMIIDQSTSQYVLDEAELFLKIFKDEIEHFDNKYNGKNRESFSKIIEMKQLKLAVRNDIVCKLDESEQEKASANAKRRAVVQTV